MYYAELLRLTYTITNVVVSGPKFTELFSSNAGGIAVDTLVF